MKEGNTGKNRKKDIAPQKQAAEPRIPSGPAAGFNEIPEKELRNMIHGSSGFFRTAAEGSITPN